MSKSPPFREAMTVMQRDVPQSSVTGTALLRTAVSETGMGIFWYNQ